jgi:phosphate-selective porin OprO/OprP
MVRAPKNAVGYTLLLCLLVAIPSTATTHPKASDTCQKEAQSQDKEEKKEDKEKKRFIYWDEGLHIIGLKHLGAMKIGGSVQNDTAGFANSENVETTLGSLDGDVEWRRARLYASGTVLRHFEYKFQYDFAVRNPPQLKDAFLDFVGLPIPIKIRGGRFKNPLGLELATSSNDLTFLERGLVSAFLPSRNTGFHFHGNLPRHRLRWSLGILRQEDDFGVGSTDRFGVSGRFAWVFHPWSDRRLVHFGVDYLRRPVTDTVRFLERPESHIAPQFVDTGDMPAETVHTGILESVFIQGPLSIQGEAAFTGVSSSETSNPSFYAFYVYASYFLSGETRRYVPGGGAFERVQPKREFRDGAGGLGAFEIAFRFSRIDLDDEDVTGGRLNDLTAAFNWYATRHYRVLTNVIRAHRSEDEPVWIFQIRLQVAI